MIKKALLLLVLFLNFYYTNAQEWEEIEKITSSEIVDNQYFSSAVDIDGNYAVVGSYGYDNERGRVFVLHYNGVEWEKVAILTASNGANGDRFNNTRISGDVIVVGAEKNDINGTDCGSAYVFEKPSTGWEDMTETAILSPSDPTIDAWFGYRVDILNNVIVVGATHTSNGGSVYIYEKPTTGWENMTETVKVLPSDGVDGDRFGSAIYITDDKLVIGAFKDDDGKGSIYLYEKPANGWIDLGNEDAKLTASDRSENDWLGLHLSVYGDCVVSGAHQNNYYEGSAYVFEKPSTGWENMTETAKLVPSEQGHLFGNDISIYGDKIIVGSYWSDVEEYRAGRAYLFEKPTTGWDGSVSETQIFSPSDISREDGFGNAVFINDNFIAIGSYKDDDSGDNSGSVFFYSDKFAKITTQPEPQSSCTGDNVTFNVIANDNTTGYQWQFNGSNISGETSSSLLLSNVSSSNNGSYRCIITGDINYVISNEVSLNVVSSTTIDKQPTNKEICENEDVEFSVEAFGSNLSYQWQFEGTDIVGATSANYTIIGASISDDGAYSCKVRSDCGEVVSNSASLTVTPAIDITSQPSNAEKCIGDNVTFSVTADNASAYQWKKNGYDISGASSSSYTISDIQENDAGDYTCEIYGEGVCESVESNIATLSVPMLSITQQPEDIAKCIGDNVTFSVTAEDATGYQWKKNDEDIGGATLSSYTIIGIDASDIGNYSCEVSGLCENITSEVATLSEALVNITSQPVSLTECSGEDVTFSVIAENATNYQWKKDGEDISGATYSAYTIVGVQESDAGTYTCNVIGDCDNVTSDEAVLTVTPAVNITSQPDNAEKCVGDNVTFSVIADNASAYQWKKNGYDISGASSSSYTISGIQESDADDYTCKISGEGVCGSVESNTATLSVPILNITQQPEDIARCIGDEVNFFVTAENATDYQWKIGGVNITGATSSSYTITEMQNSDIGDYTCEVAGLCESEVSDIATLSIAELEITSQPNSQSGCLGKNVTFNITAKDALSYQWKKDGINIFGETSSTYTIYGIDENDLGDYTCEAIGSCENILSNVAVLTLSPSAVIIEQPQNVNATVGDNISFSVSADNATSYQWYFGSNIITGANQPTYEMLNIQSSYAGNYYVDVLGNCNTVSSNVVTLNVAASVGSLSKYGINIYPNPSNGKFNIDLSKSVIENKFSIIDVTGKSIYSNSATSALNQEVDLSSYPKGIYFIQFISNGKRIVSKLILK